MYLGSTLQESSSCEREVKKRVQAGWGKTKSAQFGGETSNGVWT